MNGRLERFSAKGRCCSVWIPQGEGLFPAAVLCGAEPEELFPRLAQEVPDILLLNAEAEWERDFTPWPTPGLPGRKPFSGKAEAYLEFLADTLLPLAEDRFPMKKEAGSTALMGYSLAGLFALWALFQTQRFRLFASLSGSLWYDGLAQYWREHSPADSRARLYLSLGKTEEGGGSEQMRSVGDCTRSAAADLSARLGPTHVTLEWNRGGHFTGIPNRWRKALIWARESFS